MFHQTIFLSEYDPRWPSLFESEKNNIVELIKKYTLTSNVNDFIVDIEHIGSTAIPTIAAKPVIDIMMGVQDLKYVNDDVIKIFETMGYCYIQKYEDRMPFRRFFQKDNSDKVRTHQIHLVEFETDFWKNHLLFRDYLRAHPDDAKAYEALKIQLSQQFTDVNEYAGGKTEFCKKIHEKALAWRTACSKTSFCNLQ